MAIKVVAVCGGVGVGKTILSSILARLFVDAGFKSLLFIDADPSDGFSKFTGNSGISSVSKVTEQLTKFASNDESADYTVQFDHFLLHALITQKNYSFLCIGEDSRNNCLSEKNLILRNVIEKLLPIFSYILIDTKEGIGQINSDLPNCLTRIIVVVDGSPKSMETLQLIFKMNYSVPISVVANRHSLKNSNRITIGYNLVGFIPENEMIRQFNVDGRTVWELPPDNEAVVAVRNILRSIIFSDYST